MRRLPGLREGDGQGSRNLLPVCVIWHSSLIVQTSRRLFSAGIAGPWIKKLRLATFVGWIQGEEVLW